MLHLLLATALAGAPSAADDKVARGLRDAALRSDVAWSRIVQLSDDVGPRITGSEALERAIAWGELEMIADGLTVTRQPVTARHWVRGEERLVRVDPLEELPLIGLGGTVSTPAGGVTGDVIVANDLDHLATLGAEVAGRIVLIDRPFTDYGDSVPIRLFGASAAARLGAIAVVIRSVGPIGHRTPHTGALIYADDAPKIPAAAIAAEDASRIRRDLDRGKPVRLTLTLGGHFVDDVQTANVIGEVKGQTDEIVLVSCHLDSWDVGRGAQDDAAGCATAMEAGRLIAALPKPPRRTVRVVLFTNEEMGLAGARAYAAEHGSEPHVAAFEDDTGAGRPLGFSFTVDDGDDARRKAAVAAFAPVVDWLAPVGELHVEAGFAGSDINPLAPGGALLVGLRHDLTGYWPVHHTAADTVDHIDPMLVTHNAAALTVAVWWLADAPQKMVDWNLMVSPGN